VAPTSLKAHTSINLNDNIIWDAAHAEEYVELVSLPTWKRYY
jgi:hypothetical protein